MQILNFSKKNQPQFLDLGVVCESYDFPLKVAVSKGVNKTDPEYGNVVVTLEIPSESCRELKLSKKAISGIKISNGTYYYPIKLFLDQPGMYNLGFLGGSNDRPFSLSVGI